MPGSIMLYVLLLFLRLDHVVAQSHARVTRLFDNFLTVSWVGRRAGDGSELVGES